VAADAQEPIIEPEAVDAIVVAPPAPADAAPADAPARVKPHVATAPRPDARVAFLPTPPATKYKVLINSTPWSYFTIDNDPTKYQTLATVELAPGPHEIHFTGSEHHPADKVKRIDVPENDGFKVFVTLEAPEKDAPTP